MIGRRDLRFGRWIEAIGEFLNDNAEMIKFVVILSSILIIMIFFG